MVQNWRQEIDASDYFGTQKKVLEGVQRRPVRDPSSLVGPGIAKSATRITDFNDALATYDGYYSALSTAAHAPTSTENFVGHVVMDDVLGGVQVFTGMTTHKEYTRVFRRLAGDAQTIDWSSGWTFPSSAVVSPSAAGELGDVVSVPAYGTLTFLNPPSLSTIGDASTYVLVAAGAGTANGVRIAKTGIYTGYVSISGTGTNTHISFRHPSPYAAYFESLWLNQNLQNLSPLVVPFTFFTTETTRLVQVMLQNQTGTAFNASMGIHITRIGDAV
jgi:hypothetical protein